MSPIMLKDFDWSQTETSLRVNVKGAVGITKRNLDVFTSDTYVKIHSPPFFWELFLAGEIAPEGSKQQVTINQDGVITLNIKKKHEGLWKEIAEQLEDKALKQRKRLEAIDVEHRNSVVRDAENRRKKREEKTALMEQRMKLEEDERRNAELLLEADKMEALREIFKESAEREKHKQGKDEEASCEKKIPPPRNPITITVNFTPAHNTKTN